MRCSASSGSSSSPIRTVVGPFNLFHFVCIALVRLQPLHDCRGRTMNFVRPSKAYSFYGQTMSLCETCLQLVHAKITIEGNDVFYVKRCPEHGTQKTLVSTDADYFKSCKDFIKPGDLPLQYQSRTHYGCPYDCGLCPDHEQHSCLALIEINEECNLTCPVCFADSSPQRTRQSHARRSRCDARDAGRERRQSRSGADQRRRADHPSADLDILRARQVEADPPRHGQHQRHPHRHATRRSSPSSPS